MKEQIQEKKTAYNNEESLSNNEQKVMKTQDDLLKYLTEMFGKESNEQ